DNLETYALRKLEEKNLDLIVGNDVGQDRGVFGSDSNTVLILDRHGGRTQLPLLPKEEVAERILDQVAALLSGRPSLAAAGPMVQPREPQASLPADSLPENGG
ncbi:MAG: hypothetical protein HYY09_06030, partial [Firmicutes bacterium]|nr:hypothetical protein [Bacillota bacterium]